MILVLFAFGVIWLMCFVAGFAAFFGIIVYLIVKHRKESHAKTHAPVDYVTRNGLCDPT